MRRFNVTVNGKTYAVEVEEVNQGQSFTYVPVQPMQQAIPVQQAAEPVVQQAASAQKAPQKVSKGPASGETITAPMPGTILDIKVSEGQNVKSGDVLLILEAMKMENEIVSPHDGTVTGIYTTKGSSVNTGEQLITIG